MKLRLSATILILAIISIAIAPIATADTSTLMVGPSNVSITLTNGQHVQKQFTVMCHTGILNIEAIGVPVTVSPSQVNISSLSEVITLTITANNSATGSYNGYIQFSKENKETNPMTVSISVNIKINANVTYTIPTNGGGTLPVPVSTTTPVTPTPIPTPSATTSPTPVPTVTPVPTPTPKPTVTPEPTKTPEPTVKPTATVEPTHTPEETPVVISTTDDNDSGINGWLISIIILGLAILAILFYLIFVKKVVRIEDSKK